MEAVVENIEIKKYQAYKESGEGWIGEIPKHWHIKKLKLIFTEKKITHNPLLSCGAISFGRVVKKEDEKIPLSTKASYQEVLTGEFLINPLNLNYDLISLRIALSEINVVVSSGYIVLKNITEISKDYYKYLLHRYDVAYMKLLGSGVRQTISFNHIANSILVAPPLKEQYAIAQFLDRKTALIDKAIAIKEKQIELLKERRQILIHKAVTRGLNPNVKLKDSGVDWIGKVPKYWGGVEKLKFISSLKGRLGWQGLKAEEYVEHGPYIVSSAHFDYQKISWDKCPHVSYERYILDNNIQLMEGDILVMKDGAKMGKLAFVDQLPGLACLNSHLLLLRPLSKENAKSYHQKYMFHLLSTNLFQDYVEINGTGSTFLGISQESIGNFKVCLPSYEEQIDIVYHIESQSLKIIDAIGIIEKEIYKLREYKSSLINSAVTGKIKVC